MPSVVVLGTGTGVGKTYVCTAVLRELTARGRAAVGLKPVETGIRVTGDAPPHASDAAALDAATPPPHPRPHPLYAFPDAVSPHLAARRTANAIDCARITSWVSRNTLRYTTPSWVIIETAGGAFSPLGERLTNADLAAALKPDTIVLVAPDALGALHDTTATLAALRARALEPDLVVVSTSKTVDASTGTNAAELRRLAIAESVVTLARDASAVQLVDALLRADRDANP